MTQLIRKSYESYMFVFDEIADPVTKHWPLLAKPYVGLTILGLYLMFILKWGPKWMTNRPAFKLDRVLMVYNLLQVACNMYVFVHGVIMIRNKFKFICQPIDYSNTEAALWERKLVYYFYLLKLSDLMDTVFFVLRKKINQISFLHIYHHTGMVMLTWGCTTYYPGGHGALTGVINLLVHCFMYFYYFLSVAVPSVRKHLWIKRFITQIQMVQFLFTIIHMSTIIFKTECNYPRVAAPIVLPQNIFIFVLFADFYIKTYIKKPKVDVQTNGVKKDYINGNVRNGHNFANGKSVNSENVDSRPQPVNRNNDNCLKNEKDKSL